MKTEKTDDNLKLLKILLSGPFYHSIDSFWFETSKTALCKSISTSQGEHKRPACTSTNDERKLNWKSRIYWQCSNLHARLWFFSFSFSFSFSVLVHVNPQHFPTLLMPTAGSALCVCMHVLSWMGGPFQILQPGLMIARSLNRQQNQENDR